MNRQLSPTPAGGYDYEPGYNRVRAEHQQDFTSYSQEYPRGAMSNYQDAPQLPPDDFIRRRIEQLKMGTTNASSESFASVLSSTPQTDARRPAGNVRGLQTTHQHMRAQNNPLNHELSVHNDCVTEKLYMTSNQATFLQFRYLDELQTQYTNTDIELSYAEEANLLIASGNVKDVHSLLNEAKLICDDLKEREIPLDPYEYKLLKTNGAFTYFNQKILKHVKSTLRYSHSSEKGYICTLAAENNRFLHKAENMFLSTMITESYEANNWQDTKYKIIDDIKSGLQLPLHIVDPTVPGNKKITIVTVAEAKDRLMSIIETALRTNEPRSYASEATPKRPIVSFTKGRGSQNVSANRKPLESATRQMNYRSEEPREDNQSYGYGERALQNSKWKRIIRLSRPQEYIDFLFLMTYLQDMIGQDYKGEAQVNKTDRLVALSSFDKNEVEVARKSILRNLRKLQRGARPLKTANINAQARGVINAAAKNNHVLHLFHDTTVWMRCFYDRLELVASLPAILCVEADAVIIPVTSDLLMTVSGVGALFAGVDPTAMEDLTRIGSCPPGECIEIPSKSANTLINRYMFIVIDVNNSSTIQNGFTNALRLAERKSLKTLVCNVIGSDIEYGISVEESLSVILEGINKHVNNEKYGIETIHICDTASRIRRFTEKTGFRPENDKRQVVGKKMLCACASTQQDLEKFYQTVSPMLL